MKILIADDHALVRRGLVALLAGETGWEVVAEVETVAEIRDAVDTHEPDVLVVDYALPDGDTFAVASWLCERHTWLKVVMITGTKSPTVLDRLARSEIHGVVHKSGDVTQLVHAIRRVLSGRRHIGDEVLAATRELDADLSEREVQVLSLIAQGHRRSDIATALNISPETVKSHRKRIMAKLEVNTVAALLDKAIQLGLATRLDDGAN